MNCTFNVGEINDKDNVWNHIKHLRDGLTNTIKIKVVDGNEVSYL